MRSYTTIERNAVNRAEPPVNTYVIVHVTKQYEFFFFEPGDLPETATLKLLGVNSFHYFYKNDVVKVVYIAASARCKMTSVK